MVLAGSSIVLPLHPPVQSFAHTVLRRHKPQFSQLKQVRHRFSRYVSMALCFFKDPSRWVRNIHNRVFVMPPPKPDDQMIFSCVCNLAGYHVLVTVGTDFQ